jgi:hypothetical protein
MPSPLVSAVPRTRADVDLLPLNPSIVQAATDRLIDRVVHFTTDDCLIGVLYRRALLSRGLVPDDVDLRHVYTPNNVTRRDMFWKDYINLSITRISTHMFGYSCRQRPDMAGRWVILEFDPSILGHGGVIFTTTNNIYSGIRRYEGLAGFELQFAPRITRWTNNVVDRPAQHPANLTTDRQAEVLYPFDLSTEHLQSVVVQSGETFDHIHGIMSGLNVSFPIRHDMEAYL